MNFFKENAHSLLISLLAGLIFYMMIHFHVTLDDLREAEDWIDRHTGGSDSHQMLGSSAPQCAADSTPMLLGVEQSGCTVDCSTIGGAILHDLGCDCQ